MRNYKCTAETSSCPLSHRSYSHLMVRQNTNPSLTLQEHSAGVTAQATQTLGAPLERADCKLQSLLPQQEAQLLQGLRA